LIVIVFGILRLEQEAADIAAIFGINNLFMMDILNGALVKYFNVVIKTNTRRLNYWSSIVSLLLLSKK